MPFFGQGEQIYWTNNGNINKLWRKIKKTIELKTDPAGKIINLSQ